MSHQDWGAPELRALRDTTTEFMAPEVLSYQDQWERECALPRALSCTPSELGLLGVAFLESAGGAGGSMREAVTIVEALHEAGAATGIQGSLFTSGISCPQFVAPGDRAQIDRWVLPALPGELIGSLTVTEPGGGSDVGGLPTTARREGGDYVVNGAKRFITSGTRADLVVRAVPTVGGDQPGARGISLLVVERGMPGAEVSCKLEKMGWRCSDTAELTFQSARVPSSNLVGEENLGVALIGGGFLSERIAMAAQAYSQGQRRLDLAAQWCRDRTTFGAPLICRPSAQDTPTEMARRVDVARTYTRSVADRSLEADLVAEVCFAKNTATETGQWVAHQAVRLFGGMGYKAESNVEQQYRDMRIMGIGGGTVEILRQLAARSLGLTS